MQQFSSVLFHLCVWTFAAAAKWTDLFFWSDQSVEPCNSNGKNKIFAKRKPTFLTAIDIANDTLVSFRPNTSILNTVFNIHNAQYRIPKINYVVLTYHPHFLKLHSAFEVIVRIYYWELNWRLNDEWVKGLLETCAMLATRDQKHGLIVPSLTIGIFLIHSSSANID